MAVSLQERSHFTLLDEQRVAYEMVLPAVDRSAVRRPQECRGGIRRVGSGKGVVYK
jgi:hypothetical protein